MKAFYVTIPDSTTARVAIVIPNDEGKDGWFIPDPADEDLYLLNHSRNYANEGRWTGCRLDDLQMYGDSLEDVQDWFVEDASIGKLVLSYRDDRQDGTLKAVLDREALWQQEQVRLRR